jgi:outer membrane protein
MKVNYYAKRKKLSLRPLMKKTSIILIACFFVLNGELYAQKYGHINSSEVVQSMSEFKQMSASVDKRKKDAQTKVQTMYDTYQLKLKEMNQYSASMMDAVRQEKAKELDSLQRAIQTYEQSASAEIQAFQDKLLKPLNDKYLKVVAAIAKENGYAYIFDLASGAVAYHPDDTGDITELVKKKLASN